LLGLDKSANLVVELKRTKDGGYCELQSLRYASMVSTLTFTLTVEIYAKYKGINTDESQSKLMTF